MLKLAFSVLALYALNVFAATSDIIDLAIITSPVFPHPPAHLFCDPVGLHFRNATEICELLKDVDSDFEGLEPVECDFEGVPVEIWMHGLLNGEEVHFERRYEDFCDAKRHLGLLAEGLLPKSLPN
ncbi:hypothetical protein BD560DRAFT_447858 [Blakeslea trispora]|nr:hypothetical protein BD560DRAFT_447858 [Blakeslea trispora]